MEIYRQLQNPPSTPCDFQLEKMHFLNQQWIHLSRWPLHFANRDLTRPMDEKDEIRKSEELRSFLFLTVVMVPVLTVMIIATYGFAVWFYQMLIGGPPHH